MQCPICKKTDRFMIDCPRKDVFPYVWVCVECSEFMKKVLYYWEKYRIGQILEKPINLIEKLKELFRLWKK